MKTSLYSVLCIAIRLGAVLMAVGLVEQWPRLLATQADGRLSVGAIALDLAGLLLAFVLWLRPGLLAWWAAGTKAHQQVFEAQIGAAELQYIAFSVAGIYQLIAGVAGLFAHGLNLLEYRQIADAAGVSVLPPTREKTLFIEYIIITATGLALTLGARGLTGYLRRIRGGHLPAVAEEGIDGVSKG